ncbi:hypothetical protein ASG29_05060 [Sphingomonas sp. Leaf412]|uniref:hypothetical protein n=1 Tax=Sphingomonas sp. Leaf412 TaxID=1736370 RepID=UPI0006FFF8A8|nr:hypothetical protein [Sphingomonas sp. Leaf412]KQT33425.1 hypothetical protein ASG29_05060 [Sphingomonas sp. Leaf412]
MPAPAGPRPLTRVQALENRAFLAALRATGNAHAAARATGIGRAKMLKRRAAHPAFATAWDAALAVAQARLADPAASPVREAPRLVRLKSGKVQLRAHRPGRLTRAAEQAFLSALSASANVRLSARAAGFSHAAFYARAREHDGFAREMRLAIQRGYERLELALLDSTLAEAHADDDWRHNDAPAMPPMTPDQALQLLHLHHRTAELWGYLHHERRLPYETSEEMQQRVATVWRAKQRRFREDDAIAAAATLAGGRTRFEPPPPVLPDLAQVAAAMDREPARDDTEGEAGDEAPVATANGRVRRRHPGKALFGGWRVGNT